MNYKIIIALWIALIGIIEQTYGQTPNFKSRITANYVELTSTSTEENKIVGYSWDFGTAASNITVQTSTNGEKSVCIRYHSTGIYKVKLYIQTTSGGTKVKEKNISITTMTIPPTSIDFTHSYGSTTNTVKFKANLKNYFLCPPIYEWDFDGDGITDSNDENPTHTYNSTTCEAHTVTLKVGVYSKTKAIWAGPSGQNCTNIVKIKAPDKVCPGEKIKLTLDISPAITGLSNYTVEWYDNGNLPNQGVQPDYVGTNTLERSFTMLSNSRRFTAYIYSNSPSFVSLSQEKIVEVVDCGIPLPSGYNCPPSSIPQGQAIQMDVSSTYAQHQNRNSLLYFWDWGDGTTEQGVGISYETRTHTYNQAGAFPIKLVVVDPNTGASFTTPNGQLYTDPNTGEVIPFTLCTVTVGDLRLAVCSEEDAYKWGNLDNQHSYFYLSSGKRALGQVSVNRIGPGGDQAVVAITDDGMGGVYEIYNHLALSTTTKNETKIIKSTYPEMDPSSYDWQVHIQGDFEATDMNMNHNGELCIVGNMLLGNKVTTFGNPAYPSTNGSTATTVSAGKGICVAKYASGGSFKWVKRYSSSDNAIVKSVRSDAGGSVYIAGTFKGSLTIDGIVLNATGNSYDIFLAKFDTHGNVIWANSFGNTGHDVANDIDVAKDGSIYAVGSLSGSVNFGGLTPPCNGPSDMWFAQFQTDGSIYFVGTAGGSNTDAATTVRVNSNKDIYIGGNFSDNFTLNGNNFSANTTGAFVAKFNLVNDGWQWVKQVGSPSFPTHVNGLDIDCDGKVHLVGDFQQKFEFNNELYYTINPHVANPLKEIWYEYAELFTATYTPNGYAHSCRTLNCSDKVGNVLSGSPYEDGLNTDNSSILGSNTGKAIRVLAYKHYNGYNSVMVGGRLHDDIVMINHRNPNYSTNNLLAPANWETLSGSPLVTQIGSELGGAAIWGNSPVAFMGFYLSESGENCCDNIDYIVSPSNSYYNGYKVHSSSNVTLTSATTEARASYQIQLNPGFTALAGKTFKAIISDDVCGPRPFLRPAEPTNTTTASKTPLVIKSALHVYEDSNNENNNSEIELATEELAAMADNMLKVYPNPTNNRIHLQVSSNDTNAHLAIYDLHGKRIQTIAQGRLSSEVYTFDFNTQPAGVYTIQLITTKGVHTQKVILTK